MSLTFAAITAAPDSATAADPAPAKATPNDVIGTMESGGAHPGFRRNHAKGTCVEGVFTPTAEAAKLSQSFLFTNKESPFVGRFSNPGADPEGPDAKPQPRGLALHFVDPKGGVMNMSMINVPVFPVGTPVGFLQLLRLKGPEDVVAFRKAHPESLPFFEFLGSNTAPESYATQPYRSLHAFKFIPATAGDAKFVRWEFLPDAGIHFLDQAKWKEKESDRDYLRGEIISRIKSAPATWKMVAIVAGPGDSVTDPSKPWPADRPRVELGKLTITKAMTEEMGKCDPVNFDPNMVSAGIQTSDDPVLKFRTPAYSISFAKRLSEKKKPAGHPAPDEKKPIKTEP